MDHVKRVARQLCHVTATHEWSALFWYGKRCCRSWELLRGPGQDHVEGMGYLCMKRLVCVLAMYASAFCWVSTASADSEFASYLKNRAPSYMRIFGPARPPYGFVRFCDTSPEHCTSADSTGRISSKRFNATPQRLSELDEVNRSVNTSVAPFTDQEIYGISEYWTLPTSRGDCEDYALLKREELLARGWPKSALLLTVVRDEAGDGHAILTVRTKQGDFVLDNKVSDVRIWSDTAYQFVMRQSYVNPKVWVSLDSSYAAEWGFQAGAAGQR